MDLYRPNEWFERFPDLLAVFDKKDFVIGKSLYKIFKTDQIFLFPFW